MLGVREWCAKTKRGLGRSCQWRHAVYFFPAGKITGGFCAPLAVGPVQFLLNDGANIRQERKTTFRSGQTKPRPAKEQIVQMPDGFMTQDPAQVRKRGSVPAPDWEAVNVGGRR